MTYATGPFADGRLGPLIALTFDDGPDPEFTPPLLDALAQAGARATFFPLSPRLAAYPDLVRRIRAEGHLVGLHGWAHLKHPESTRAEVARDTERALAAFDEPVAWWRLPYGMAAPWSAALAARHGLRVAGWTHDTHDWRGDAAADMRFEPRPGEVVLMHDGLGPGIRRTHCRETVALARELAEAHGSVRLDELDAVPTDRPG